MAPPTAARSAFETKAHRPRETSTILPVSESFGSVPSPVFGSFAGPQRCDSTGLPSVPTTVVTSTSVWSRIAQTPGNFWPPAPWIGSAPSDGGPPTMLSTGAKTCEFETAATEIASGALPGEPAVPRPKSSRSLPAAITGTTPASAVLRTASFIASFAGSVWGPPPEKLITFIPSATAASNACTISGVFAWWPSGVGTVKTR